METGQRSKMNHQSSATPDYSMGFSEEILEAYRRHTAESSAAYMLSHIRPGFTVLDFGCGPGTISSGLAKAAAPGEMHGVDMEESQIDIARAVAEASGIPNAYFHTGDVTALMFEDDFFDLAHCHNVLMHIPDTRSVLAEIKRVLKPGGIIACREMICESSFTHPDLGVLRKAWDMFEDLVAADDGHPQMGKDMKGHIEGAGFVNVQVTASFDIYSTPADIEFINEVAQKWFLAPEITEAAIKYGATTRELCDRIGEAYERWRAESGALCGLAFGEIVASKP